MTRITVDEMSSTDRRLFNGCEYALYIVIAGMVACLTILALAALGWGV